MRFGEFFVGVAGIARESPPRRRSSGLWAPAHGNFLLKISAPPSDPFGKLIPKRTRERVLFGISGRCRDRTCDLSDVNGTLYH